MSFVTAILNFVGLFLLRQIDRNFVIGFSDRAILNGNFRLKNPDLKY